MRFTLLISALIFSLNSCSPPISPNNTLYMKANDGGYRYQFRNTTYSSPSGIPQQDWLSIEQIQLPYAQIGQFDILNIDALQKIRPFTESKPLLKLSYPSPKDAPCSNQPPILIRP